MHSVHLMVRESDEMMSVREWLGGMLEMLHDEGSLEFVKLVEDVRAQLPRNPIPLQGPGYARLLFPSSEIAANFGAAVLGFAVMFDHSPDVADRMSQFARQIMEQSMWVPR